MEECQGCSRGRIIRYAESSEEPRAVPEEASARKRKPSTGGEIRLRVATTPLGPRDTCTFVTHMYFVTYAAFARRFVWCPCTSSFLFFYLFIEIGSNNCLPSWSFKATAIFFLAVVSSNFEKKKMIVYDLVISNFLSYKKLFLWYTLFY